MIISYYKAYHRVDRVYNKYTEPIYYAIKHEKYIGFITDVIHRRA